MPACRPFLLNIMILKVLMTVCITVAPATRKTSNDISSTKLIITGELINITAFQDHCVPGQVI